MNVCPLCGGELQWQARPGDRVAGFCPCNPAGPVVECPASALDVEVLGADLFFIPDIRPQQVGALVEAGFLTLEALETATNAALLAVPGIGPVWVTRLREFLAELNELPF